MSDPSDAPKSPGGLLSESADKLLRSAPRPMSARDALAAARAAESQRDAQAEQELTLPEAEPEVDLVVVVLRQLVADAVVLKRSAVHKRDVFSAVWQSHQARARIERNLALAITASTLIDAAQSVPSGHLFAVEVALGTERRAVWVDTHGERVLATASPPGLYLIG